MELSEMEWHTDSFSYQISAFFGKKVLKFTNIILVLHDIFFLSLLDITKQTPNITQMF